MGGAPGRPRKKSEGPNYDRQYQRLLYVLRKDPVAHAEYMYWVKKDREANPEKYTRAGVPDGMRRAQAIKEWAIARGKAAIFMEMIDEPIDEVPAIPDTDEGKARLALHELTAIAIFRGTQVRDRIQALNSVLAYTKEKPVQKVDNKISAAEDWLKAAVEASKSG